jgi:hypothetical protein
MMSDDTFGFSGTKSSTAERLKAFRPTNTGAEPPTSDLTRADAAGERVGFKSREPVAPAVVAHRRKKDLGPTTAINTRAPQRVAVPFIAFCEENRFSYWEGIEELMRRAGVIDRE